MATATAPAGTVLCPRTWLTLEVHTDPEGDTYRTTAWPESGLVQARFVDFSVPLDELWAATTRSYGP